MTTNYVEAKVDKMQPNSKYRLCGDTDERIYHIISKCSKLVHKKYKTRHDSMGKLIHWEFFQEFKFGKAYKCYMHNPESVQENETHKFLWDFKIQTDHLISTRRIYQVIVNEKKIIT